MNFIAAVLLYHGGEVSAFYLLTALMEKYDLKSVLSLGLPGLAKHEEKLEELCKEQLPELFKHFEENFVPLSLFSTDWIISIFMNFIPIELSHEYLGLFFEQGWPVFYKVGISILKFYEKKLLEMKDAGDIIG